MTSLAKSQDMAIEGHVLTGLPQVNLLPPEIIQRTALRKLQGGLGVVVLGAFIVVGLFAHQASSSVSAADESMTTATAEQAALQAQLTQYADVTAAYARTAAVQQLLVDAMSPEVRYSRFLDELATSLPAGIWLNNSSWTQTDADSPGSSAATTTSATALAASGAASGATSIGTATFTGIAPSHDDVATWLEALASQKGYAVPYLQTSAEGLIGTRRSVTWTATVVLTTDALSGRYVTAGGS